MKPKELIVECLIEFARVQSDGNLDQAHAWREGDYSLMLRAANGNEIWFSHRAIECTNWLAQHFHQNGKAQGKIRIEEFAELVRKALVDGYSDQTLRAESLTLLPDLRRSVAEAVEVAQRPLEHHFPAWSIDIGEYELRIGPVVVCPIELWLSRQRFAPKAGAVFFTQELPESEWKARFRAYRSGELKAKSRDMACMLARVIGDATHVAQVSMPAQDVTLSRQQARLLAQSGLDALALMMESPSFHRHWVLRDQPSAPEVYDDITAS